MPDSRHRTPRGGRFRRSILGAALAAGVAAALLPPAPAVGAADRPAVTIVAQAAAPAGNAPGAGDTTGNAAAAAAGSKGGADAGAAPGKRGGAAAGTDAAANAADADAEDSDAGDAAAQSRASRGAEVIIQKGNKHIRIQGIGRDGEYDSFEQFVQKAPWLAGLVFLCVLLVFLVPLLIIVLLIWYKMRKNRLANETMLKLAERGVVPASVAMDAVASGNAASFAAMAAPAAPADPPGTPAYAHAVLLRRRVVWSDLRKGVIFTGVGLGLTLYSMFDDGSPNGIGLIFLFVGLGYCLLWFLEDRTNATRPNAPGAADARPPEPPAGSA